MQCLLNFCWQNGKLISGTSPSRVHPGYPFLGVPGQKRILENGRRPLDETPSPGRLWMNPKYCKFTQINLSIPGDILCWSLWSCSASRTSASSPAPSSIQSSASSARLFCCAKVLSIWNTIWLTWLTSPPDHLFCQFETQTSPPDLQTGVTKQSGVQRSRESREEGEGSRKWEGEEEDGSTASFSSSSSQSQDKIWSRHQKGARLHMISDHWSARKEDHLSQSTLELYSVLAYQYHSEDQNISCLLLLRVLSFIIKTRCHWRWLVDR